MIAKRIGISFALFAAFIFTVYTTTAQTFSVADFPPGAGFSSPAGIPPSDILFPGPFPAIAGAGGLGGPAVPPFINTDALCWGYIIPGFGPHNIAHYEFSVSSLSGPGVGISAAGGEASSVDHTADIFSSDGTGSNLLLWDGDGVASPGAFLAGLLGLPELVPPSEDTDAWANNPTPVAAPTFFFSVDTSSALFIYGGAVSGADVLIAPSIPGYDVPVAGVGSPPMFAFPYVTAPGIFLDSAGFGTDDIDALVVIDDGDGIYSGAIGVDTILFSLTPGSMSLATSSPYFGATAGDILIADTAGLAGVFLPHFALGLDPLADLNALDIQVMPQSPIIGVTTSSVIETGWHDLVTPYIYTVQVANASLPLSWMDVGSFTATGITHVYSDTNAPMSNLMYRVKKQPW